MRSPRGVSPTFTGEREGEPENKLRKAGQKGGKPRNGGIEAN